MKQFDNKQTGVLSHSDLKTFRGKLLYWVLFGLMTLLCLLALFPTVWVLLTSFKQPQEIYSSFSLLPQDRSIRHMMEHISESWKILKLGGTILNTFLMSLGSLAMTIVVCGFGGYVLSKLKPRGSKLIFVLVVWTMMMPSEMRIVPSYISWLHFPFAFDWGGVSLLDTYWPMWLGAAARAFDVVLFKNSFDALSQSYVEAGKLDGCGNFGIFFRIMLPLSMPVIIYVSITTLSMAWSQFFVPLLVLDKNVTLPVQLYRMQSDKTIQMNTYFMGLIFGCIPSFIIFVLFQKHIMGGVNIGGVKG